MFGDKLGTFNVSLICCFREARGQLRFLYIHRILCRQVGVCSYSWKISETHTEYTIQMKHSFHAIRCHRHHLYTVKQTKLSLSSFDDKRYLLDCSIHSLPYGHKALKRRCDSSGAPTKYRKCGECGQDRLSDYTDCRV